MTFDLEQELSRRGRKLLDRDRTRSRQEKSGHSIVRVDDVFIEDTQGTLYIYKQSMVHLGLEGQDLIYAEDIRTGRRVGRGDPEIMQAACELLRQRMVLDDLADV